MLLRAGQTRRTAAAVAGQESVPSNRPSYQICFDPDKKNKKNNFVSVGHVWLKFHPSVFFCRRSSGSQGSPEHIAAVSRGEAGPHPGQVGGFYRRATLEYKHPLALTFAPSHRLARTLFGSEHPGEKRRRHGQNVQTPDGKAQGGN